jgi:hypothetical protein
MDCCLTSPKQNFSYIQNRQHKSQKKKDKQLSIKHTHKSKDRVIGTPTKNQG